MYSYNKYMPRIKWDINYNSYNLLLYLLYVKTFNLL